MLAPVYCCANSFRDCALGVTPFKLSEIKGKSNERLKYRGYNDNKPHTTVNAALHARITVASQTAAFVFHHCLCVYLVSLPNPWALFGNLSAHQCVSV